MSHYREMRAGVFYWTLVLFFSYGVIFHSVTLSAQNTDPSTPSSSVSSPPASASGSAAEKSDLKAIEKVWLDKIYSGIPQRAQTPRKKDGLGEASGVQAPLGEASQQSLQSLQGVESERKVENPIGENESYFRNQPPASPANEVASPSGEHDSNAPNALNEGGADNVELGTGSIWSLLLRLLFMMVLVLGGFYLLFRFLKKKTSLGTVSQHDLLEVIASISLPYAQGGGKSLQIVDMVGSLLLISVSDTGVRLISKITEKETVDRIRLWQSQNKGGGQAGTSLFASSEGRMGAPIHLWKTFRKIFSQNSHARSQKSSFWAWSSEEGQDKTATEAGFLKMAMGADSISPEQSQQGKDQRKLRDTATGRQSHAENNSPSLQSHDFASISAADSTVIPGRLNALLMEQRRRLSKMGKQRENFKETLVKGQQDIYFDET